MKFNSAEAQIVNSQKHLGLTFSKITKCNKIIDLIKNLSSILSRKSLLTIYKSFVNPNLRYTYIIYNKPLIESFEKKIEVVQNNWCFQGTLCDKIHQELRLESLADQRWIKKRTFFQKIILGLVSSYLKAYLISCDNTRTYLIQSQLKKQEKLFLQELKLLNHVSSHTVLRYWETLVKNLKI